MSEGEQNQGEKPLEDSEVSTELSSCLSNEIYSRKKSHNESQKN